MPEQPLRKILITGATGYIGRRLTQRLLGRPDLTLRLLVRNRAKITTALLEQVEIIEGDTFDAASLGQALAGVDTAYYLIHSMGGQGDFAERDRQSAENFRTACITAGVRRVIYLGGLGHRETASRHLASRIETGEILGAEPEKLQLVWFRAGVIIGAGSASFEIIRNLVQKLPVMITPKWVMTRTQPIGVQDVLSYLEAALDLETGESLVVDIGAEQMSFRRIMLEAARAMGLHRLLIPVPVLSPRLSSFWLILFTPVPFRMAAALVEGLKSETIAQNDNAARIFPEISPRPYSTAVEEAMAEMEHQEVISRWCDSSGGAVCDIKGQTEPAGAILRDRREVELGKVTPAAVYRAVCNLGGTSGWYDYQLLWRIRGWLDKLAGGYGLNRGRRLRSELRIGDAVDFWKVADLKENKRVLLLAQMKVPGKAWLEFDIQPDRLVQTAHFNPRGLLGRLYWYSVLPLHHLVFGNLARGIVRHAARLSAKDSARSSKANRIR